MKNSKQLANRFREVLLNGKWIANTNYKDLLSSINFEQSNIKISSLNTIANLAQHINYYIYGILKVFEGENLTIKDKYSFDFPKINTEKEWRFCLEMLIENSEKFAGHIENMSNKKLEEIFVKKEYGNYRRNIEGMIEHCYYHLGQISLIKKLVLENET